MLTSVFSAAVLWAASGAAQLETVANREAVRAVENIYYVQLNGMT